MASKCFRFSGRLEVEFFYGYDWQGVVTREFVSMLDAYLRWCRYRRIKSDLSYMSPR